MTSFHTEQTSIGSGGSSNSSNNSSYHHHHQRTMPMGRKRSRLGGFATFASALAISVSAAGAFPTALPHSTTATTSAAAGTTCTTSTTHQPLSWQQQPCSSSSSCSTRLHVLADPEVFLQDQLDLVQPPRPLSGIKKDQRGRKVPPRVSVKSRNAAAVSSGMISRDNHKELSSSAVLHKATAMTMTTTKMSVSASSSTTTPTTPSPSFATSSMPPRRQKKRTSSRQTSTMPGFQSGGAFTGRQKAFRDGIKLVENRTGKKLTKYVDTPAERKKRRAVNGEAMYKSSASVPDSLIQFASEIHSVDRITPKEEIELGELTQEAIRLQNLHEDLSDQFDRPPTDEEWCAAAGKINLEAVSQAIEDGLEAKNKLVTSNLRMVQGVVNLYIRNGLGGQYNAGDLMQEGIMALIRAAEKFDPGRGFRFSTYAMYWIRSAVKRSQIVQSRVITVPQRLYENHKRILRTEKEMRGVLGRRPTRKELGDAVGMSEIQVERCVTAMNQRCFSLDQGITNVKKPMSSDRSSDTLIDIVDHRTDDGEFNKQKRTFLREDLIETLNRHLAPEEVELLLLRYGLKDDLSPIQGLGPLTIASVSQIVGLKPDKVRRMINKSLKHLQVIIGDEWKDYDLEFR